MYANLQNCDMYLLSRFVTMDLHAIPKRIQKRRRNNDFWDLVTSALFYASLYYIKYIHKEPCMTSFLTGEKWMQELLNGNEKRCFNMFRMSPSTFRQLCMDLETKYGLRASSRMSILEKVGIFVYTLSKGASNRDVQERFQHSGETVSRIFKEVLDAVDGLSRDILRPRDPEFKEIPQKIVNDTRYMPHFKVSNFYFFVTILYFSINLIVKITLIFLGLHWRYRWYSYRCNYS